MSTLRVLIIGVMHSIDSISNRISAKSSNIFDSRSVTMVALFSSYISIYKLYLAKGSTYYVRLISSKKKFLCANILGY